MKITNYNNVPDIMIEALTRDEHEMGDSHYSVTQLLRNPRQLQLSRRHKDEVTRDAVDMWNSFIGTCVHGGIYQSVKSNTDYLLEKRVEHQIATPSVGEVTIGGTPDAYQYSTKTLFDHKTMQVSAYGLEVKDGYEEQMNIYAYILETQGLQVDKIFLNVIYLDWRLAAAKFAEAGKYPPAPVALIPIRKWSKEATESYIEGRVALHQAAELLEDDELPECSAEDCWESPQKLAVYRKGFSGEPTGVRAMKLCDNYREVTDWVAWKKMSMKDLVVVDRPRTRRKCEMYCDSAPFCNQYKEWKLAQEVANNVDVV